MRIALAAALVWLAAGPAPAQTPASPVQACGGGLCGASALTPWFEDLERLEGGAPNKIHVLQIGDSHTAGEVLPGTVRSRLQGRFGAGGRGYVAPGVPYDGYAPRQFQLTAEGWNWTPRPAMIGPYRSAETTGLFGGPARPAIAERGSPPGLTLALDPETEAATVGLCGRSGWWNVTTHDLEPDLVELRGAQCRTVRLDRPTRRVTLSPHSPDATLDGIWLEGPSPGLILSNVGHVGATLADFAARDEQVVRAELAPWPADLVILAFGTNEGFDDALDLIALEGRLHDQVRRVRNANPGAAVLILGAPDALRRGESAACEGAPERGPPRNLGRVRDVQRRVAAEAGAAFWDWHGRMGGDCSAERLARGTAPMMRPDRVHFTSAGAEWIGGLLADDLLGAYDAWKSARAGAD